MSSLSYKTKLMGHSITRFSPWVQGECLGGRIDSCNHGSQNRVSALEIARSYDLRSRRRARAYIVLVFFGHGWNRRVEPSNRWKRRVERARFQPVWLLDPPPTRHRPASIRTLKSIKWSNFSFCLVLAVLGRRPPSSDALLLHRLTPSRLASLLRFDYEACFFDHHWALLLWMFWALFWALLYLVFSTAYLLVKISNCVWSSVFNIL